ncbi:MAG: sulfotransferase domain-containing protein [Candidatus Scalindua sp.]
MKSVPITIHVGLMKTATTSLQNRVFPQHEELNYLGGPEFQQETIRLAIAAISKQDRLMYDQTYHEEQTRNALNEARNQGKPVLLSAESLSTPTVDRLTKAERLVGLFGDIRILICLRRPEDLMTSLYSESIKQLNPKANRLPTLDSWLEQNWSDQRATRHSRILDFYRFIQSYQDLVGEENVCVLLFEELCNEPAEYARQLSEFVGINTQRTLELLQVPKENKSVSQLDYNLFKLSNLLGFRVGNGRLLWFVPRPIKEIVKRSLSGTKHFTMSDEWRERIRAYCREENKDLYKLIGPGPERYDYF